jgi:hypothetical protein
MKTIITLLIFAFTISVNAQKFYKDKTTTLNAVTEKSYTYAKDPKNPNIYWYKRYDSYGESIVQLTFEVNTLRKVVIVHLDPTQTLNRLKDVYAKTTDSEADSFDPPSNGYGKGEASNTPYYSGKARYECSNNYNTSDFLFTIIPLD